MPAVPRPVLLAAAVVLGAVALAVAVAVAVAIASAGPGEQVGRGVQVGSIELAGLSRPEAESRVTEGLRAAASSPLRLLAAGEVLTIDPVACGLALDAAGTVDAALSAGPFDRVRSLLGVDREVRPSVAVDEAALTAQLRRVAEGFDRQAQEGSISFTEAPAPQAVLSVAGRSLDVAGSVEAVRAGWLRDGPVRIELPVELTPVRTTAQEIQRALEQVAVPAVAAPVTVDVEGDPLVVEPGDIAQALRFEPDSAGRLVPRLAEDVLYQQVRYRLRTVGEPPVDATFDVTSGTPVVVAAKDGRSVSPPDLAAAVLGELTEPAPRTASAPLSFAAARISTAQAGTLGVREQIGTFTTRHPCCAPRVENIHRIAEILDGHVLLPGETFDLNAFVGPRDQARGFVPAPQIFEGEFVDAVGGGISQFATTLFNAVFFSGLEDVEHVPHSYYISRYPPGREATVSFPLPDLIFRNDSPDGVLVDTSFTGTSITVTFWGTKRFDEVRALTGPRTRPRDFDTKYVPKAGCSRSAGQRGFDIVVTRVMVAGGNEVQREDFRTRYLPQPRLVCGTAPRRATRPSSFPAPAG